MLPTFIRTTTLLFILACLQQNVIAQAPTNDDFSCASPETLTPGTTCVTIPGTVYLATVGTPTSTCGTTYDVWYAFVVPAGTSTVDIDVAETSPTTINSTNTYIQAFSETGCTLSPEGACTAIGTTLSLTGLTPTDTYFVRVFTTTSPTVGNANRWDFTICVTYPAPPSNDDCSGATTLTSGSTNSSGTVWNATDSGIPLGCATGNPDDDVWYKITSTGTNLNVSLTAVGSNLLSSGAMIQVFSGGTCGTLASLACGTNSLSVAVSNSGIYYIRVYSSGTGSIGGTASGSIFSITATTTIAPGNDECAGAYVLPTSTTTVLSRGTVAGATASSGIPIGSCTGTPDDDVWYKFVATKSAPTISLSNIGSNLSASGARLQLLSGTCGSLSSVACGTTSIAASSLSVGSTYYLRVYSGGGTGLTSSASFDINVLDPSPSVVSDSTTALFNIDTVARQLGYPWEISLGPDDSLWITEARGYRVLRVSGSRTESNKNLTPQQVLKVPFNSAQVTFGRSIGTWPQGGMQGLAIHPEFSTGFAKQLVYLAYVYTGTCPAGPSSPCIFRTKIVRCQFYYASDALNPAVPAKDTLVILDTVISNLPGSNDHNSGRLKIGPVKEGPGTPTYKLYYTIGDMGAGQFNNTTRVNYAQILDTCEGKVLRLNTEPDLDPSYGVTHDFNTWREWIPNDNPYTHSVFTTLPTPIYSYGHRNAQGLAWGNVNGTWRLYSSEHGDRSDDEVNIIVQGKNYGWPKITGMADNNYTTNDDASDGFTLNNILANQSVIDESSFAAANTNYENPMFSFLNWTAPQIQTINTGNIFTWPTVAPSSIDFYNGNIPGWKNSLLVTSLKYGMFRLKLNSTGNAVDSNICINAVDTFPLLHGWRVRDIAINPDPISGVMWVIIDSSGSTSGPTGGFSGGSSSTKDGGKILKLTYKTMLTLPVQFISFTGRLQADKTVRLNWVAETDNNHRYFEVERSADKVNFISLGTVSSGAPYSFIDQAPMIGDNYYRIRQVNQDGISKYSKTIHIVYDPSAFLVSVYPNPIKDVMNIKFSSPQRQRIQIQVMDVQGRILYQQYRNAGIGTEEIQVNVKDWSGQLFVLKVTGPDARVLFTQKIIKQ